MSLIDWAANAPYGVECLYRYNTPAEWDSIIRKHQLTPLAVYSSIDLYPPMLNLLFGRRPAGVGDLPRSRDRRRSNRGCVKDKRRKNAGNVARPVG